MHLYKHFTIEKDDYKFPNLPVSIRFLCMFLADGEVDFPAVVACDLGAAGEVGAFERNVAAKAGLFDDFSGDLVGGLVRTRLAVGARREDGRGSVDARLQEQQDGLEEADGQEARALNHDQATAGPQDTRNLIDGTRIVDIFARKSADDVIERVHGKWNVLGRAVNDEIG